MPEAPIGKMHFDRLDDGTDAEFQVMRQVHERNLAKLPDLLLSMLSSLKGDAAYPVDRLEHSVQTATRAMRDGADEELIVSALFHDVGETLGPLNPRSGRGAALVATRHLRHPLQFRPGRA